MKRYLTVLTAIFVLLLFGTSLVWASISIPVSTSISIPPANPTVEPPGKLISPEEDMIIQAVKRCGDNFDADMHECRGMAVGAEACIRDARERLRECMRAVHSVLNPPQLILPNGNSPGQGN